MAYTPSLLIFPRLLSLSLLLLSALVRKLISEIDRDLYQFFESSECHDYLFCHRWLLLDFKREFTFQDSLRIFEVSSYLREWVKERNGYSSFTASSIFSLTDTFPFTLTVYGPWVQSNIFPNWAISSQFYI